MGMFKDIRTVTKQAKQIDKTWDPKAARAEGMAKLNNVNEMMKAQTAALTSVAADGLPATAQVVSVGASSGMVNNNPIVPVELLVMGPDGPPRPVSLTLVVPLTSLARLQPGATLPATVSASNPDAVVVNWAG
jgi:hypothetical protein